MKIKDNIRKELLMRQGQSLFEKNKYRLALEKFTLLYNLDNKDSFASLWVGFCLAELENYAEAQDKFLEAISLNPDNLSFRAFLATNYLDQDMVDKALETIMPLMSNKNPPKPVSDSYGLCLLRMGKIEEGYKALTLHSAYIGFFGVGSRVLSVCELYLSANLNVFTELEENISHEMARNFYTKVRTKINNLLFRIKVLLIDDAKKNAYKILALAEQSIDQKDYSRTKQHIADLLKIKPDNDLLVSAAETLLRIRDYSGVVSIADSISDYKNSMELKTLKILSLLRLVDLKSAEALLGSSERLEDSYLYGLLYLKQGLFYKVRKKFETVLKSMNIDMGIDLAGIRLREVLRVHNLVNK